MRAVVLEEFGPPENLTVQEVPDPEPGPGQILIEVAAAGVPFVDVQTRAGGGPRAAQLPDLPYVPGNGVGGRIVAVGPGVDLGLVGTRVVSTTGGRGGYAELVAVDATWPVEVPEALAMPEAVALLADGRTAVALTELAPAKPETWVLVEAAGGGLGSLLVQLAREAGARVIGAAGSTEKRALAQQLGAEVVVDYTAPEWTERVREATGGDGLDLVFDGVGGDIGSGALRLLRDGGRFVVHGMASGAMTEVPEAEATRVEVIGPGSLTPTPENTRRWTRTAFALAVEGRVRPRIGQTYPLERAAEAHAAMERRTTVGKTLLIP